jgi:signal transduction histidine kinase/ActR/RegA family two-component response regulator
MSGLFVFAVIVLLLAVLVRRDYRRAIQERSLRRACERALKHTTHLSELGASLARAQTESEVLQSAVVELVHALDATAGVAIVLDTDGGASIAHPIGYEPPPEPPERSLQPGVRTPIAESIRRQELLTIESRRAGNAGFGKPEPGDFLAKYEAAAVVPLVLGHRTIGAVALSFARRRTFEDGERALMLTAGRQVAQALERSRGYERAEHARAEGEAFKVRADAELGERQRIEEALRESEGKYRALATRSARLYELSAALSEAITLDAVAKVIVRNGRAVVGASAGSVTMLVEGGREFETLYAEEYTRQVVEAWHRFPAESGLCATAAADSSEPVYVASLREWQALFPRSAAAAADGGYSSGAALPLLAEGSVLGILSFHFTAPVNFNDDYTALLRAVAQHCAQALDRARLYEAAQRARSDAESANRAKDDFLSTLSHELRTPLSAMLGWASMLRSGSLDPGRTARALDAIFNNATRQARLIEDLLDVSRIIAGRASVDLQEFDPADSVHGAVDTIMPLAESKGVDIRVGDLPPVTVAADPRRLEQVFLNLLSNAVKFTPPGGLVEIDGTIASGAVDLHVSDSGSGIDPSFVPHVFERFRQADSTRARRAGGLGLGLFIARQLVEAQGGSIRVESAGAGRGATFSVRFPIARMEPRTERPMLRDDELGTNELPPSLLNGVRVLLVDDEPDTREVMASALETRGAIVTSAGSARDALATLGHGEFDVLLADIAMPDEDGYELIQTVRSLPMRAAAIPAAAVTACASESDRDRALAAGFQIHLAKPVPPEALARTVAALAASSIRPRPGAMPRVH